jgi:hypothetical protein
VKIDGSERPTAPRNSISHFKSVSRSWDFLSVNEEANDSSRTINLAMFRLWYWVQKLSSEKQASGVFFQ